MTNRHLPYYGTKTNGTAGQPLPITPMEWLANWELNGRRTALSAVNQPGEVARRPHPQTFALSTDAKRNSRQTMNPEGETFMTKLKKPAGAYLIGIAVTVAAFFITNPLLAGLLDPAKVWAVLDILMLIGLLTALAFNYAGKRTLAGGQEPDDSVSRRNLEINIAFYLTAGVTISVSPQLVFIACPGARKPGGQPSGVGNLGSRGHDAATGPGHHRLSDHEGEIIIKPNRTIQVCRTTIQSQGDNPGRPESGAPQITDFVLTPPT